MALASRSLVKLPKILGVEISQRLLFLLINLTTAKLYNFTKSTFKYEFSPLLGESRLGRTLLLTTLLIRNKKILQRRMLRMRTINQSWMTDLEEPKYQHRWLLDWT